MKRGLVKWLFIFLVIVSPVYANEGCTPSAQLVNQDPYPGLSGNYVEVLFQLNGVSSSCEDGVAVDLILDYPLSLDSYDSSIKILKSSTYAGYGYDSFWNNVYKIRIDEDAIEGDYEVEFRYKEGIDLNWETFSFERFNITIEDAITDFEVHIDNHNIRERGLFFQILNIGNQDIEALTLEIPIQENIVVKGSNRNIVGDLDSSEYTTASFEAIPTDGEITVLLHYTDSINERRTLEKKVYYNSIYFADSLDNLEPDRTNRYLAVGGFVLFFVILFFIKRKNKIRKV
jgi:hypothetical protein|tara:strand:+ start:4293 stop:5153 length:861 start_codon:yes stop_codon:yes gene_type:complete